MVNLTYKLHIIFAYSKTNANTQKNTSENNSIEGCMGTEDGQGVGYGIVDLVAFMMVKEELFLSFNFTTQFFFCRHICHILGSKKLIAVIQN